jgi:hypothetical protein
MEVISVFYSTTEDAGMQTYQQVFRSVASQVERLLDVRLDIQYWREMAGGLGASAQSVIDERVRGKYQIYFGVMGHRFGGGTAGEYRTAVEAFINDGKPNYVCFGFCEEPANPFSIDPESLAKLIQFRKDIGDGGKYGRANLYFTFADHDTYRLRVETHLKHAIGMIKDRVAGGRSFGRT